MKLSKLSAIGATAITASIFAASSASAATELEIDLNNFMVTSSATGNGFELTLEDDANTSIQNIRIDGVDAPGFVDPFPGASFVGSLTLVGDASSGTITGGSYNLDDGAGNTFSFGNIRGSYLDSGSGIELVLLMQSSTGDFSSNTFAGVDVSAFNNDDSLPVSAIGFFFNRTLLTNPGSTDNVADTDITVTIPSPTAATAGLGLMGLMALGKRRRKA